ncbi:MAG TPA: acyl-CoA dehydrogenase [Burkholderiales bacterium]
MNFDYNEEQQLLADSVRRFLARDYGFEARRQIIASPEGWSAPVWETFAGMGLLGLPLSADYGGFGGGAVDLMAVMEALGEALVVEPYLSTLMGALAISRGGSRELKSTLLPAIAQGKMRIAFAASDRQVIGAPSAQKLAVVKENGGDVALYVLDAGAVTLRSYRTLDGMRAADVTFSKQPGERLEGGGALLEEVLDFGTALICAEAVGAMQYACDATLEFLKTRKQFGVPIGTFQALQHRMVDMVIAAEQARSMACLACSKVDHASDARERARAVSAAKIKIADAARHVSQESIQLHGGMGMTEELKISHTFRRLTVIAQQFGDADHHLARFAAS